MVEREAAKVEREAAKPHVAEWFGHRVFPAVARGARPLLDQTTEACPFLTQVAERPMKCVKAENSKGVCTISATSNGPRQDWLVCPHRALDDDLLHKMVRRLFKVGIAEQIHIVPVTNLEDDKTRERLTSETLDPTKPRQFLTFQQLFGGEIGLPKSDGSPDFNFDVTIVEVVPSAEDETAVTLGKYGVVEIQTTDTHGSYKHAVEALKGALDLHRSDFAEQVEAHPDWPGRSVEGPNISNVFKRTFYQIMFKFQITRRDSSAGCILALPRPVWDSWKTFLGNPSLLDRHDGTFTLQGDIHGEEEPQEVGAGIEEVPNWIYVFDISDEPPSDGTTTPVVVDMVIATDTPTLSRLALEVAPRKAIGDVLREDSILFALRRRMQKYSLFS